MISKIEKELSSSFKHQVFLKGNSIKKIMTLDDIEKMTGDNFHILLRNLSNLDFHDFDINLFDKRLLPKKWESTFYKENDKWYDMVVREEIFISLNEEPVGLQLEFENINYKGGLEIADDILENIEFITKNKGEIWLVLNSGIVQL